MLRWRWACGVLVMAGILVAAVGGAAWAAAPRVIWVATDGDDTNPGSEARPLATLEAARDAVRKTKEAGGLPDGGVIVRLKEGTYVRRASFVLEEQDSGTEKSLVVYEGASREKTIVSGALSIPGEAFRVLDSGPTYDRLPAEARGKVVTVNLREQGYGDLKRAPDTFEDGGRLPHLFYRGQAQEMARWPNEGYAPMGKVYDKGGKKGKKGAAGRGGTFGYEGDRPVRWKVDDNLLLRGFLRHDWHHEVFHVGAIDTTTSHTITLDRAGRYEVGGKWKSFRGRYIVFNAPEELDQPGEWTVDFTSGDVAFWPPESLAGRTVEFTDLQTPVIHTKNASYVTIRNMTMELGRDLGVRIYGGRHVTVANCTIRDFDRHGAHIQGGFEHGIQDSEFYGMGQGGAHIWGGDRKTLTPGGHYMVNCHVHDYGRLKRTYAGAAWLGGVGNRIAHCKIHQAPHTAVFYNGNEHVIEYNEMYDLMQETGDAGATYTGRDWTSQGNIVRYNYMHDLGGFGALGSNGIYLDDCDSGDLVHGNIVVRARTGMLMGGGRDNTITNNIFIDCTYGFRADSRGEKRMKFNTGDSWDLEGKAKAVNYQQPPWSERYPWLVNVMDEDPTLPLHDEFARNLILRCKKPYGLRGKATELVNRHGNWVTDEDPGFVDMEGGDLRLKSDAPVFEKVPGFERIPFEKIGLLK